MTTKFHLKKAKQSLFIIVLATFMTVFSEIFSLCDTEKVAEDDRLSLLKTRKLIKNKPGR
jgi:hypothetical protein